MNKDKQLFDITEEFSSQVKIKFNEYAIEKYGCSDLELQKFHTKYDQAVSFYHNKKEKRKWLGNIISTFGLGVMCSSTGIFYHNSSEEKIGVAAGLTIAGLAIYASGEILQIDSKNEYNLKKKNPYIDKNTKFEDMAKDYCKMKKWIREKV